MSIQEILTRLSMIGCFTEVDIAFLQSKLPSIKRRYDQWHRKYHNWSHVENLITLAYEKQQELGDIFVGEDYDFELSGFSERFGLLLIAILFHDVVQNPTLEGGVSERLSNIYFLKSIRVLYVENSFIAKHAEKITTAIAETEPFTKPTTELSKAIRYLDQYSLLFPYFDEQMEITKNIRYEYRHVNLNSFVKGRRDFLFRWLSENKIDPSCDGVKALNDSLIAFGSQRPTVGIFQLTGIHLHMGHWSVIQTAMKMFDRVCIHIPSWKGHDSEHDKLRKTFPFIQITKTHYWNYFIQEIQNRENPTIIRAIRNDNDLRYEMGVIDTTSVSKDKDKIVPTAFIPVDAQYRHLTQKLVGEAFAFDDETDLIPSMRDLGYSQEELDEMLLGDISIDDLIK